jgi:hypothetical protein
MNKNYIGMKLKDYQGNEIEIKGYLENFQKYGYTRVNSNSEFVQLIDEEELINLINKQDKINESINRANEIRIKQEEEKRKQEEKESIGNFLIDNPMQHARAKKVLNKIIKFKGDYITRKEFIKKLLKEGYRPKIIDKMVTTSKKIKGERKEIVKYNVPIMDSDDTFYTVTKTEYNYALYLIENELLAV